MYEVPSASSDVFFYPCTILDSEPTIRCEHLLKLPTLSTTSSSPLRLSCALELVVAAQSLVQCLDNLERSRPGAFRALSPAYRLELVPSSSAAKADTRQAAAPVWVMQLHLDTLQWFRHIILHDIPVHRLTHPEMKRAYEIATRYAESCIDSDRAENARVLATAPASFFLGHPKHCAQQSTCRSAVFPLDRTQPAFCRQGVHSNFVCKMKSCNFASYDAIAIHPLAQTVPGYRVEALKDSKRVVVVYPEEHLSNKLLILRPLFWLTLLTVASELSRHDPHSVAAFAVNFGSSMGLSIRGDTQDAHGHGHIILTYDGALACGRQYPALAGRTDSITGSRVRACEALERTQLASLRAKLHEFHLRRQDVILDRLCAIAGIPSSVTSSNPFQSSLFSSTPARAFFSSGSSAPSLFAENDWSFASLSSAPSLPSGFLEPPPSYTEKQSTDCAATDDRVYHDGKSERVLPSLNLPAGGAQGAPPRRAVEGCALSCDEIHPMGELDAKTLVRDSGASLHPPLAASVDTTTGTSTNSPGPRAVHRASAAAGGPRVRVQTSDDTRLSQRRNVVQQRRPRGLCAGGCGRTTERRSTERDVCGYPTCVGIGTVYKKGLCNSVRFGRKCRAESSAKCPFSHDRKTAVCQNCHTFGHGSQFTPPLHHNIRLLAMCGFSVYFFFACHTGITECADPEMICKMCGVKGHGMSDQDADLCPLIHDIKWFVRRDGGRYYSFWQYVGKARPLRRGMSTSASQPLMQ